MLVVMKRDAAASEVDAVVKKIEGMGLRAVPMPGAQRTAVCVLGNDGPLDPSIFRVMVGVKDAIPVSKPYKLVSRESRPEATVVRVDAARIGGGGVALIAGPCAVESEAQCMAIAEKVKEAGAEFFRGGAYKPRTSPYSFQGLGEEGLKILARVRERFGLYIVTEAIDHEVIRKVADYADVVQIGARNMQNYSLLRAAGKCGRPVLLKRGMSATIEEWLMAAEYVMSEGNPDVILCERGVRTFGDHSRNTLDLSAVLAVRALTHLPVITDPSHAAGRRDQVIPLARASAAIGVDGLMIEVHHEPDQALSDGPQSLYPEQFAELAREVKKLAAPG
ncbi:MAG TPA: 3-deoxy-7-phosphoheptulonate synthase [bacterium]|nr:3-deoxy-7-phosphoheptulonate synthase [bacterium]